VTIEIELMPDPVRRGLAKHGPVECAQSALVTVDPELFEKIWAPSTLELLARSYWRFLRRRSLGAIRVSYGPDSREIHFISRKLTLLRFHAPRFRTGEDFGEVEWPIEKGLLVASEGEEQGFLKMRVTHGEADHDAGIETFTVTSEVANFYPWIRGSGWFARLGTWIYSQTQFRVHVWITKGFLRSLADLPAEVIRKGEDPADEPGPR
jgi:hypothetical protein